MARTIKMQKGGITGRLQEQYGQSWSDRNTVGWINHFQDKQVSFVTPGYSVEIKRNGMLHMLKIDMHGCELVIWLVTIAPTTEHKE